MAPPRRISTQQLEIMIDYLEQNKEMCMGLPPTASPSSSAHLAVKQKWIALAKQLNGISDESEGALKTPDGWKKYWFEWRHKTKKKANDSRRYQDNGSGGPSRFAPLDDLEVRVLALCGNNTIRTQSKPIPIKDLENMLTGNSDSDAVGGQSPDRVKAAPASTVKATKPRSSNRTGKRGDRSGTPPPRWAIELEERRIAAEERMADALQSMAEIMKHQEERRSMLEERMADTLTSIAGNVQELHSGIHEAVMHLQRVNPISTNGLDIKDHVFM